METSMKINLGSGRHKMPGYVNVDVQALPGVDIVCDCNKPIPIPDNSADAINATDFLEHIDNHNRIHIMTEIWRILKPGGIFTSLTPSTDGRGWACDPTHYSFWNELSFRYYTDDHHRNLYGIKAKFKVIELMTTPLSSDQVCHVKAVLECVKERT